MGGRAALFASTALAIVGCGAVLDLESLDKVECANDCSRLSVGPDASRDEPETSSPKPVANEGGVQDARVPAPPREAGPDGSADANVDAGGCNPACAPQSVCVAATCTAARRVFISSAGFTADFGGSAGGDSICQNLASAAGLGGVWRAWVSDAASSPSARFARSDVGYRLVDGTLVANDWLALTTTPLARGIDRDERGLLLAGLEVWTATSRGGAFTGAGCNGFTSSASTAPFATVGVSSKTDPTWSDAYLQFCDRAGIRLYCFEQ